MKAKKLNFKKGKMFMQEARFTHKGKRYIWGIGASGFSSVFYYTDWNVVKQLDADEYRQLCIELNLP